VLSRLVRACGGNLAKVEGVEVAKKLAEEVVVVVVAPDVVGAVVVVGWL